MTTQWQITIPVIKTPNYLLLRREKYETKIFTKDYERWLDQIGPLEVEQMQAIINAIRNGQ